MYASLRAARHTELRTDRRDRACLELTFLVSHCPFPTCFSLVRSFLSFSLSPPPPVSPSRSPPFYSSSTSCLPPRAFVTVLSTLVTSQLALALATPASPLTRLCSRPRASPRRILLRLFIIIKCLLYWSRKYRL